MNVFANLFKKKDTIVCQFCKVKIDKTASIVIQYKAADGLGHMDVCMACANELNNIVDMSTDYEK
jgi:hypothetical protein